jgi:hypothetical protein
VNARCAPWRILATRLANQVTRFLGHRRSSRLAAAHLPGPVQSRPLPVPLDHRLRFHNDRSRPPAGPESRQPSLKKSIGSGQLGSLHRALQHVEVMAKSQHLHLKSSTSAKAIPRCSQNGPERRSWDEETDEAQVPMYQPNQNFREPSPNRTMHMPRTNIRTQSAILRQSRVCDNNRRSHRSFDITPACRLPRGDSVCGNTGRCGKSPVSPL